MNKKVIIVGVIILIILAIAGYFILNPMLPEYPQGQENNTNQINNNNTMAEDLKIETLQEGSGEGAKTGDMVTVNYTGTLVDGTKFDSSLNPGRTPFQFTIGPDCVKTNTCVIEGWNLGVTGMKVGEKRKLTIPSNLGYGPGGNPPVIPPNATLLFEIDLLKIN